MTHDERLEELSTAAAMTLTLARAFNLWNKRLERSARLLRQEHTRETKMYLGQIADGCEKMTVGLRHFEDWAIEAGVTDSGHMGDEVALACYLNDGAWLAQLAAYTFNASACNDGARTVIKSYCKAQVKNKPKIDWKLIDEMQPK